MIIFVEGADGSGKSELIKSLSKMGYKDISDSLGREKYQYRNRLLECFRQYKDDTVICDRSFITEIVYRLYDGKMCDVSASDLAEYMSMPIKFIWCDNDSCFNDSIARGETNITDKKASDEIRKIYSRIMDWIFYQERIAVLKYDWHKDGMNRVINFIAKPHYDIFNEILEEVRTNDTRAV